MKYLKFFTIFTLLCLLIVASFYTIKYLVFSPKMAEVRINEAPEKELSSAEANINHGADNYQRGQYDEAISDFSKAIEINPAYAEAYTNRGNAYATQENYDQAISDYNESLKINPRLTETYNNRGIAYGKGKGQYDKAISDFNKAIEINPTYAEVYFNKALVFEKTGRVREAVEVYKEFIQHAPPQHSLPIEHARKRIRKLEGSYGKRKPSEP